MKRPFISALTIVVFATTFWHGANVTAEDRTEGPGAASPGDRELTQKIRRAIDADDSLSTNAKHVQVITIDGVVTLRGPVANEQERNAIVAKVKAIGGATPLDNRLDVSTR
jgi:osmotically-inducible protein OsmY